MMLGAVDVVVAAIEILSSSFWPAFFELRSLRIVVRWEKERGGNEDVQSKTTTYATKYMNDDKVQ